MLIPSFQILTCVYFRTKLKKKLNRNLTEEEDSIPWSKIVSQVTVKKTRMEWQRSETFFQGKRNDSFDNGKNLKLTFSSFFAICIFFSKTNERKMKATPSQTRTPVTEIIWQTHSDFSFDRTNFFNMVHLHCWFSLLMESFCSVGNGFMVTVTNIEILSDHLVYYENVDVIAVVTVVRVVFVVYVVGVVGVVGVVSVLG